MQAVHISLACALTIYHCFVLELFWSLTVSTYNRYTDRHETFRAKTETREAQVQDRHETEMLGILSNMRMKRDMGLV